MTAWSEVAEAFQEAVSFVTDSTYDAFSEGLRFVAIEKGGRSLKAPRLSLSRYSPDLAC